MEIVLALLLGVGLAASTGLNTSLPLLMLAAAAKFHFAGLALNTKFAWLQSDVAILVLLIATLLEIVADKFPAVDHLLDTAGTFVRPVAGALAAASVLPGLDPAMAAVVGLIVGAPISLGFHAAKAATRIGSTATTGGCANPVLSLVEDFAAAVMTFVAIVAPLAVPILVALALLLLWRLAMRIRRGATAASAAGE